MRFDIDRGMKMKKVNLPLLKQIGWICAVVLVLAVLFGSLMPLLHENYTRKTYAMEMLEKTLEVRNAIEKRLASNPNARLEPELAELIPSDLWYPTQCGAPTPYVDYGYEPKYACLRLDDKAVLHDGTVIVHNEILEAVLIWRPRVVEGKVQWTCRFIAIDKRLIPPHCRSEEG
jgi:hypothetical protein